jgi:hypothetical protein
MPIITAWWQCLDNGQESLSLPARDSRTASAPGGAEQVHACQSAAYALRRTCHASELRATPSQMSWIPSNTPSSQIAVVVRLAKR